MIVERLLPVVPRASPTERDCAVAARRAARPPRARGRRPRLRAVARRDRAPERRRAAARRPAAADRELSRRAHPDLPPRKRGRTRTRRMIVSERSLEDLLGTVASPVELLRNSQAGPERLPRRSGRVHELARRANGLAEDLRPLQPVVPHGRSRGRGPGRAEAALAPRRQQLRRTSPSTGRSTSCPCTPDGYVIGDVILFALAEDTLQPRRARTRAELDHLPRGDRRLRRQRRARPAHRAAHATGGASRTASRYRGRTRCR